MNTSDLTCATVTVEAAVAEVTLTATGKANRMGPDYWAQLPTLFARLDEEAAVRAIVLRGAGEHFSFGLDLAAMGGELAELLQPEAGARARQTLLNTIRRMQDANTAVARCRKPVIAAVSGWCIGGGVDLITACDVRLASADAKFSVREVKLAMVADVGTLARLPAIVGQGVARELAFTGDDVDAARALRIGLVNEVYPTQAELLTQARAMAVRMARNSPLVLAGIKEVMNAQSEAQARESLATVALWNAAFLPSKDLLEAMGAFLEKREPTFCGE
ncbi:MAG: crotonase/enoyl-CoA hydratase family protein [Myxococcaceae bacterium]|nr:crotonase/enoyl-CoA hydratase family protein [Myxococcaceae bacterium]